MKVRERVKPIALAALAALLLVGCGAPAAPFDPAQGYAVYSALLSLERGVVPVARELSEFDPSRVPNYVRRGLPEVGEATWADLRVSPRHPRQLEDRFDPQHTQVRLIDASDVERIWKVDRPERCRAFADAYLGQKGFYGFSQVAFTSQMDEAVLHARYRDCNGCGGVDVVYLRKVEGKWTVQARTEFIHYGC